MAEAFFSHYSSTEDSRRGSSRFPIEICIPESPQCTPGPDPSPPGSPKYTPASPDHSPPASPKSLPAESVLPAKIQSRRSESQQPSSAYLTSSLALAQERTPPTTGRLRGPLSRQRLSKDPSFSHTHSTSSLSKHPDSKPQSSKTLDVPCPDEHCPVHAKRPRHSKPHSSKTLDVPCPDDHCPVHAKRPRPKPHSSKTLNVPCSDNCPVHAKRPRRMPDARMDLYRFENLSEDSQDSESMTEDEDSYSPHCSCAPPPVSQGSLTSRKRTQRFTEGVHLWMDALHPSRIVVFHGGEKQLFLPHSSPK